MALFKVTSESIKHFSGFNAVDTIAITPSDANPITADAGNPKGYDLCFIQVMTAGNVTVVDGSGNSRTYTAPPVGFTIPFAVKQVKATGTTSTVIGLIPKF